MDLSQFMYHEINKDGFILDRLYNQGHGVKQIGNLEDLLKLPLTYEDNKKEGVGVEETKDDNIKNENILNIKSNS